MRRAYAAMVVVAAVSVFAAGCGRRAQVPEGEPAPAPVVTTTTATDRPPPPEEPAAAAEQATTDLDSVDQVLREVDADLSGVDAPPPDAD